MNSPTATYVLRWKATCAQYSSETIHLAHERVVEHARSLADYFYESMLADDAAAFFLSDKLVQEKLHASLQAWMRSIFGAALTQEFEATVAFQQRVGEVHARINIPVHLVMRGTRALIRRMQTILADDASLSPAQRWSTGNFISEIMLFAVELMSMAYAASHDRNARAEEGYRLLSLSQNIGTEKERQRAALLDWENQLLFGLSVGQNGSSLPRLSKSEFGLWFNHKAAHAFEGTREAEEAKQNIIELDRMLDEADTADTTSRIELLHALRDGAKAIGYLVDALFEKASQLESGRDTLTHLLNRKYLHVVMSKEVAYARKTGSPLSVLMVDVDFFKRVNDEHGHDAGDFVLQQVASLISTYSRGGDYTFRLGGEEFLVVLVDATAQQALQVAESLRLRLADKPMSLPDGSQQRVTMSVGVAAHDGHPDYQRLLKRADQALYAAKARGRNACVLEGM
ncbi:diguanylate cyclase [Bordetella trematum]|uniref:diguanylate cyclase n=1 Tax=Bordetella trematum TaxID=123899 RepID=UPI000DA0A74E|nr:diguanylate cyclase [Bordetella trematum]SPU50438.1 signaling protein [Bordetella trematum]VDH06677.1 Diguanylate cyclase DosC [Bordetella trematum]